MKKTREADLFVENGLSLELWADQVANGSGNPRIFRGTPGRIIASNGISALEVPSGGEPGNGRYSSPGQSSRLVGSLAG